MKKHSKSLQSIISKSKFLITAFVVAFCLACSPEDGNDGVQGQQGIQGEQGTEGNANVSKYVITVANDDWDGSYHFGDGNSHTQYTIPAVMTGDVSISSSDYLILAFGRPYATGFDYSEKKPLPYTFGINNSYGIKFELMPNRSSLIMSKTTNGWDSSSVPIAERPDTFTLELFMVEVNAANRAQTEINFNNYNEVVEYFSLNQ